MSEAARQGSPDPADPDRRTFFSTASSVAMASGLLASYGTLAYLAGRFLYPNQPQKVAWMYVVDVDRLKPGEVLRYETPMGQVVTVTRRGESGTVADFLALSSTCPHLGCKVHWEPQNNRFFCPCHNGVFDPSGQATAGPPAEARQSLPHYPLAIENGMLFIELPAERLG
jgi:Rieske Fe-S protein